MTNRTIMALAFLLAAALNTRPATAAQQPPATAPQRPTASVNQQPRIDVRGMARPIDMHDSIWIEDLTMMEVRDLIRAGKTTALILTGGIEENGPYLTTGKHNNVLRVTGDAIARSLGNALPSAASRTWGTSSPRCLATTSPARRRTSRSFGLHRGSRRPI
jgi:hypothetical protein